jgi:hypothetical protein
MMRRLRAKVHEIPFILGKMSKLPLFAGYLMGLPLLNGYCASYSNKSMSYIVHFYLLAICLSVGKA